MSASGCRYTGSTRCKLPTPRLTARNSIHLRSLTTTLVKHQHQSHIHPPSARDASSSRPLRAATVTPPAYSGPMGLNRENVTWQRPDGTWAIGFWGFRFINEDSPDFDYEWDVEYANDFAWAATGYSTPEQAMQDYTRTHANPGGTWVHENTPDNHADIARLEDTLSRYEQQHHQQRRRR